MARRTEHWEAGDYYQEFQRASQSAADEGLRAKMRALAQEVEPLDREFCRETASCGRDMGSALEELQAIAERLDSCGTEDGCRALHPDVDRAIAHLQALRENCFV
jgi:hypothetical protein